MRKTSVGEMFAILGGLGAALAWSATTLVASRASRIVDAWSLLATVMAVGLLVSAPVAAVAGVPSGLNRHSFGWLAVSGMANVAGLLLTYAALSVGKVGVVAPVTSTEGAVAAVIAVIAGEQLSGGTVATLIAIAAGVALAAHTPAVDGRVPRSEVRAVVLAAGAAMSFGLGLYSTGRVGQTLGVAWAALPPRAVGVLVIALPLLLARRWRMTREALPYAVSADCARYSASRPTRSAHGTGSRSPPCSRRSSRASRRWRPSSSSASA